MEGEINGTSVGTSPYTSELLFSELRTLLGQLSFCGKKKII